MSRTSLTRWSLAFILFLAAPLARAEGPSAHPLRPPDRSSPRATLTTFLEDGDGLMERLKAGDGNSMAGFRRLFARSEETVHCLDMSHVPAAARYKAGRAAAFALYQTLNRIHLPPASEIPDAAQMASRDGNAAQRWTIPDTEISFVRVEQGPGNVEYLFSPETVTRAREFAEKTQGLPGVRANVPDLHAMVVVGGGWMIPPSFIRALPPFFRAPVGGQAVWKWVALVILVGISILLVLLTLRITRKREDRSPLVQALAQFAVPLLILVMTPIMAFLILVQVNVVGDLAIDLQLAINLLVFVLGAWVSWRLSPVIAELILSTPSVAPGSIDAHLVRLFARLVGVMGALALLALGAGRLGIPVYGIVAGLGVGGLAVALAAQPTFENLIAGLNLFADRPLRVGDQCKVGDTVGMVETIGIRSTRIRARDETLTIIPNGALWKVAIHNRSMRKRRYIETIIGLRYETTQAQMKAILAAIEAMLANHPKVIKDGIRARFVKFGASSLDVEVRAYVDTVRGSEFQTIRQEVFLSIMEIVEREGSGFAFPSTTVYLGQDRPPGAPPADA